MGSILLGEGAIVNDGSGTLVEVVNADNSAVTIHNAKVQGLVNLGTSSFTNYPLALSADTDGTLHPTGTATSTTNYPSSALQLQRSYWTGSAAATGTSKLSVDAAGTLQFTNESGSAAFSVSQAGALTATDGSLIGDSTNGWFRFATDSSGNVYLEGSNGARTGSAAAVLLTGLNGAPCPVKTYYSTLDDGSGRMSVAGSITSVGGQSTSGPLGVGAVVAQVEAATIGTANTFTTYLSTTAPANGLYLVSGYAANGTASNQWVSFRASWTDPSLGSTYPQTYLLAQNTQLGSNAALVGPSVLLYAQSGSTISVQGYTSSTTGVYFSAAIVRLV
jgi:hypothetical protein